MQGVVRQTDQESVIDVVIDEDLKRKVNSVLSSRYLDFDVESRKAVLTNLYKDRLRVFLSDIRGYVSSNLLLQ